MKRKHRLSRSRDFDSVYRQGRSVTTRYLVLYTFARSDETAGEAAPRLGLAVSRRIGGAVERNWIKRRLREAFAAIADEVPADRDYVLIVRPGFLEAAQTRGSGWLDERVREVFARAPGGLAGSAQRAPDAEELPLEPGRAVGL
jgi:ribonuclease P protein component